MSFWQASRSIVPVHSQAVPLYLLSIKKVWRWCQLKLLVQKNWLSTNCKITRVPRYLPHNAILCIPIADSIKIFFKRASRLVLMGCVLFRDPAFESSNAMAELFHTGPPRPFLAGKATTVVVTSAVCCCKIQARPRPCQSWWPCHGQDFLFSYDQSWSNMLYHPGWKFFKTLKNFELLVCEMKTQEQRISPIVNTAKILIKNMR